MSKGIELVHKSSWQNESSSTIIELCPASSLALTANSNQVTLFDYLKGDEDQSSNSKLTLPPGDTIASVSFHPSGKHVLVATQGRLLLANALVDGTVPFWEAYQLSLTECKFNLRGSLFAAICGTSIVVYNFINGNEVVRIKSSATASLLSFGQNCSIFADVSNTEEGTSALSKFDALTGETLAEFKSEDGNTILAYALANDTKPIILSSNSVIYLNKELNQSKIVSIEDEYTLSGAICVSSEGLVFVGLQCKESQPSVVRIYSAVGGDYFDQPINKETVINAMNISRDNKYLIVNNSSYQINDNRVSNSYITSLDTVSAAVEEDETDNQSSQLLVSTSFIQSKEEEIKDLQSRVIEREVMNEVQLCQRSIAHTDELNTIKESYNTEIGKLEKQRDELIQRKKDMIQEQQSNNKTTTSNNLLAIHELEESLKVDLVAQASEYSNLESAQQKQELEMKAACDDLLKKHETELTEFRLQAEDRRSRQAETTSQLEKQRDSIKCECKERIARLEDDIDDSISLLTTKFEKQIQNEREVYEKLHIKNGLLTRRIESGGDKCIALKERVSSLLQTEDEKQKKIKMKEDESERLCVVRSKKETELASKTNAVSRLLSLNHQLIKSNEIETDRLKEMQALLDNGPLSIEHDRLCHEMASTTVELEKQQGLHASMENRIVKLNQASLIEKDNLARLQSKIRSYDSTINYYLIQLEDCNKAIQNPTLLKENFTKMCISGGIDGQSNSEMTADEKMAENQHTLLFLEKNEIGELTAENAALINKFKEEKANQIAVNAALLKRVSFAQPARRRSTIFRS